MESSGKKTVLDEALASNGLRTTRQRQLVYNVMMENKDHPTAEEVFWRVKDEIPHISLATVYNCLETLVDCGLIRQVNRDRDSTRYCGNLREHGHFYCNRCGMVIDIELSRDQILGLAPELLNGFAVERLDISFRGFCSECRKPEKQMHDR